MDKEKELAANGQSDETQASENPPVEQTTAPAGAVPSPDELAKALAQAEAQAQQHYDQWMRTVAELDNTRKRHQRELENAHKYALERFVGELLGVRDSLELGVQAAQADNADVARLREGMDLTLKMFVAAMEKFQVEQLDPVNEPFNPELHQAMTLVSREDLPPNTVVSVVQKGYTLNGRLVRPALVMVSQG
jgi:molecular chaperone GrpE